MFGDGSCVVRTFFSPSGVVPDGLYIIEQLDGIKKGKNKMSDTKGDKHRAHGFDALSDDGVESELFSYSTAAYQWHTENNMSPETRKKERERQAAMTVEQMIRRIKKSDGMPN